VSIKAMAEKIERLEKELAGSLFDATDGFDAVKKAKVA
jgi:hypothetical protein